VPIGILLIAVPSHPIQLRAARARFAHRAVTEVALHEIPLRHSLAMIKLERDPRPAMADIFAAEADRGERGSGREADGGDENLCVCEHRVLMVLSRGEHPHCDSGLVLSTLHKAHRAPDMIEDVEDTGLTEPYEFMASRSGH